MVKKKILFVIDSLKSGGAEKSLVSLLTLFDYSSYEVDLLMFSNEGLYMPLLPKEVNILDVPNYFRKQNSGLIGLIKNNDYKELCLRLGTSISLRNPLIKKHGAQINWTFASKGLNKLDKKYDVAIAYSQGLPTYFVVENVSARKKFCWVNIDYKIAGYNKQFDKYFYDRIDNIVAVSDSCKDVLINELPSNKAKVNVIYDIISPTLINSMSNQTGGFKDNYKGTRILTIGRLVYQKGYEMAIEACKSLKNQGYQFRWYAIGEGDLRNKLEGLIRKNDLQDTFIFLGTHQNPYTYLKQCDIYVQPSRFEGYGLAIAEARILKKPIVATNFTVVHNQIRNEENGLIVEMNSEDIFNGIKRLIEDNNLRNDICLNLENEKVGTEGELQKIYALLESV
ncbi:glycosyltransferase [Neobacillus vireti]|uniref:glycosyltransferase n=1 Tax=Neobacillus vireti TaxID=220686 RepID=UPI002FFD8927